MKMNFSELFSTHKNQTAVIFNEYLTGCDKIFDDILKSFSDSTTTTRPTVSWDDNVDEEYVPYVEEKHHHDGETYYDDGENLSTGCSICKKIGHRKDQCLWLKPEERGRRCVNCRQLGHCKSKCFQPETQQRQRRCGICGNNEHTKANCTALIPFYERV